MVDHAGEARFKLHLLVAEAQTLGGALAQVQYDLAVLDVGTRHVGAFPPRIDDHVRGVAALGDPLMHGAQQVGALGQHLIHGIHGLQPHLLLALRQALAERRAREHQLRVLLDRLGLWRQIDLIVRQPPQHRRNGGIDQRELIR